MTPREVVTRAIEFRRPPRLPINGHGELSDIIWVGYDMILPPQAIGYPGMDQWLCWWDHSEVPNMGQVKGHPLEDLSRMKRFPWPDGSDSRRYVSTWKWLDQLCWPPKRDKYVIAGIFMILWERMHTLHGFENCMMDLMDDTPQIHELADRILEYDIQVVRNMHRICGSAVQGFSFTEDWGTEADLMVSPELFRRFFQPRYKKLFKVIHECGWHVWMHSCGKINKAIGPLIEAGLDVVNMQQPRTNGIEEIGGEFAGKITFETLCDIQKTLPAGDRDQIVREAEQLMHTWGTSDGGFILGDYGDHVGIGAQPETKDFMVQAFLKQDPYTKDEAMMR
ncbi:MAG TPA: uroporphyrinogen decarboxylase family protein [Planctomycetota bacterium]|nr:uroporphyrinogen decarboxylase family protein [Planctomycetota bacterium]